MKHLIPDRSEVEPLPPPPALLITHARLLHPKSFFTRAKTSHTLEQPRRRRQCFL